jgi:ADP-ribosylglycohydrolase/O-acetyl-ADP-ribose deacetylase (regulator of RNase III)
MGYVGDRRPSHPGLGSSQTSAELALRQIDAALLLELRTRIEVVQVDITTLAIDAIVTAANNDLLGGGGVDGAIHRAAGPLLLEECKTLGGCSTGEAKITKGYLLPARQVIHTVGPMWYGGQRGEADLLSRCYRRCLDLCEQHQLTTVAFPPISTGMYGYPLVQATRVAVREVLLALQRQTKPARVLFACMDRQTVQVYQAVLTQETDVSTTGRVPNSSPQLSLGRASLPPNLSLSPANAQPSSLVQTLYEKRILGGLWGSVTGDALGVPVEFQLRSVMERDPVTDLRGYGTYNQPPGTWSDDSSLMLCTLYSLLGLNLDTGDMAQRFVRFLDHGYMTPAGNVFDVGTTTAGAIGRLRDGTPPEEAGGMDETDNGNGSLARMLPLALRFFHETDTDLVVYAHRASALTHRHPRTLIACGVYSVLLKKLLLGAPPAAAYASTCEFALAYYSRSALSVELPHFDRLLAGRLAELPRAVVPSSGYVVHSLEASIWALLTAAATHASFSETLLRAVNLGGDTDTIACVTGALAGVQHGVDAIPEAWRDLLVRQEDLEDLFARFVSRVLSLTT